MNSPIISTGLRPGHSADTKYNTWRLLKLFGIIAIVVFLGGWLIFEITGYIPGINSPIQESFINPAQYFQPSPEPANIIQHPDSQEYERQQMPSYDTDILRANRYYELGPGQANPSSSLFSLNNEMPSTYMLSILNQIQAANNSSSSKMAIPLSSNSAVKSWLSSYQTGPNDIKHRPSNLTLAKLENLNPADLTEEGVITALTMLFSTIRLYIITQINLAILAEKQSSDKHPFQPFKIVNSRNTHIRALNSQDIMSGLELVTDMSIYRDYKTHTFNIQATVTVKPDTLFETLHGQLQQLALIGSTISGENPRIGAIDESAPVQPFNGQDATSAPVNKGGPASRFIGPGIADIALGDYSAGSVELDKNLEEYERRKRAQAGQNNNCAPDSPTAQGFRYMLYENGRASLPRNLRQPKYENGDWTNTDPAIEEKVRRYLEVGCGRCFGVNPATNEILELPKYSDNKVACESSHEELGGQVGIWDTPCKVDSDCPYFQANKNYTNTFGKCIKATGTCEMPVGAVRMGYKLEHKRSEPRCNNCNKIPGYDVKTERDEICCELQKNKLGNMGINSPDYRFAGDLFERLKPENKSSLVALGLKP